MLHIYSAFRERLYTRVLLNGGEQRGVDNINAPPSEQDEDGYRAQAKSDSINNQIPHVTTRREGDEGFDQFPQTNSRHDVAKNLHPTSEAGKPLGANENEQDGKYTEREIQGTAEHDLLRYWRQDVGYRSPRVPDTQC